ncbi:MAG TPA: carboxypeptidase-like regulatory domain-containing protein [Bryobacteraceae bacterium]|nr:carboxypeptidase-like regulatory domain-containing protein [Bryobacteraceae bacterium]
MHLRLFRSVTRAGLLAAIFLCSLSPGLMAQNVSATLTGTVMDATTAVVGKASVALKNELSGDIRRSVSNAEGFFNFSAVPPGTYTITVELQGFSKWEARGIVLDAGDRRNVTGIVLKPGMTSETVTVEAASEYITPVDSGDKSSVITQKQLQNVSVLGRNAAEFIKILPGMAIPGDIQNRAAFTGEAEGTGTGPGGRFAPVGLRKEALDITADGAHIIDPGCNCGQAVNTNADMMQEIKVMTSNFGAEASKGPVLVTAIGKQGGQSFHGEAYLYARHHSMNANDWDANSKGTNAQTGKPNVARPPTAYWYPGFQIGGPVLIPGTSFNRNRDKLFFHFATEYYKQDVDNGIYRSFVPTADMRNGIYTAAGLAALGTQIGGDIQKVPNDPDTGLPFPGGIIPSARFNKYGKTMINMYPLPNVDSASNNGFNYVHNFTRQQNMLQIRPRLDYSISDNTKLYVSYNRQRDDGQQTLDTLWWRPDTSPRYPTAVHQKYVSDSVSVNLTHVFNPTLTSESVFTYTFMNMPHTLEDPSKVSRKALGLDYKKMFNNTSDLMPDLVGWSNGVANMIQTGFDVANGTVYAKKKMPTVTQNISKVWSTHTAKFGFYWERVYNEQPNASQTNGRAYFSQWASNDTDNAYANMLLGIMSGYEETNFNPILSMHYNVAEGFAQDSWKVSPRLTLDYGVRLSHMGPWTDAFGTGFAVWDPAKYSNNPADKLKMTGVQYNKIDSSIPLGGYPSRALFVNPRFGFAWDMSGSGKTVVRGGFGLYHYHDEQNVVGGALNIVQGSYTSSPGTTVRFDQIGNYSGGAAAPGGIAVLDKNDDQQPRTMSYSLTVSRRLPWSSLFEVSYVGNKSDYLSNYNNSFGGQNYLPWGYLFTKPGWAQNYDSVGGVDQFRPMANYQSVRLINHEMYSNYNSLQASWNKQSGRFTFMTNYTFSKALGIRNENGGNGGDDVNLKNMYGVLGNNRTHIFNAAYVVEMGNPVTGNRVLKALGNGWQLSGVTQFQSGVNLQANAAGANFSLSSTIPAGYVAPGGVVNPSDTGSSANNINGTPDIDPMPILTCDPRKGLKPGQYINGSCFAPPMPGKNGSFVMPLMEGPAFFNSDLSVFKNFVFSEQKKLQFRFSGYNFLNHPINSFVSGDNNLKLTFNAAGKMTNDKFGYTSTKLGHRAIQLALKFYF